MLVLPRLEAWIVPASIAHHTIARTPFTPWIVVVDRLSDCVAVVLMIRETNIVHICKVPTCDCKKKKIGFCIHILFVLIRVLRVPEKSDILLQRVGVLVLFHNMINTGVCDMRASGYL